MKFARNICLYLIEKTVRLIIAETRNQFIMGKCFRIAFSLKIDCENYYELDKNLSNKEMASYQQI